MNEKSDHRAAYDAVLALNAAGFNATYDDRRRTITLTREDLKDAEGLLPVYLACAWLKPVEAGWRIEWVRFQMPCSAEVDSLPLAVAFIRGFFAGCASGVRPLGPVNDEVIGSLR